MSELDYSKDIAGLKNSFGLLKPSEFEFIQARRAQKITPQLDVLDRNRAIERKERSEDLAYKTAKQNFKAAKTQIEEQDKAREALRDATWKLPEVLDNNSLSTEEKITSVNTFLLKNPQLNAAYPSIGRSALDTLRFKSQKEQQEKAEAETKLRREEARERNIRQYTLTAASSIRTPEGQDYFKRAQEVLNNTSDREEAEGVYFRNLTNIMAAEGRATVDLQKQRDEVRVEAARLKAQSDADEERRERNDENFEAATRDLDDALAIYASNIDEAGDAYLAKMAAEQGPARKEGARKKAFPAKNRKEQQNVFLEFVARKIYEFNGKQYRLDMEKVEEKQSFLEQQQEIRRQIRAFKNEKPKEMTEAEKLILKQAMG
jgi:hypothetical protein